MADNFRGGKRKKRKLPKGMSRAVTIAPGKRYYGPPELRPSTKYKRGGELAQFKERGGKIPELKGRGFVDIERAKFQMQKARGMPPAPGQKRGMKALAAQEQIAPEKKGSILGRATDWARQRLGAGLGQVDLTKEQTAGIAGAEEVPKGMSAEELLLKGGAASTMAAFAGGSLALSPGTRISNLIYRTRHGVNAASRSWSTYQVGPKTFGMMNVKKIGLLSRAFRAMGRNPLTVAIGVGSIGLSLWAKKEAPEMTKYMIRDERERAELTGDWTEYNNLLDSSEKAAEDLLNSPTIDTLATIISPIGIPYNIGKAIMNMKRSIAIERRIAEDIQSGASVDEIWKQRKQDEKEEAMMLDASEKAYYKRLREADIKAKASDREFWANLQKEKQENWEMYWEERAKEDTSPSNLKFGLL